jgi:hypothetical protein
MLVPPGRSRFLFICRMTWMLRIGLLNSSGASHPISPPMDTITLKVLDVSSIGLKILTRLRSSII